MKKYFFTSSRRTFDCLSEYWKSADAITHYLFQTAKLVEGEVVNESPNDGFVFFLPTDQPIRKKNAVYVALRADKGECRLADFELVNAPCRENDRYLEVYPWPIPGIKPRNASRGTRLSTVAYLGNIQNLHDSFMSDEWISYIKSRGLNWSIRSDPYLWNDYSEVDIAIGVRNRAVEKPPTKIINAWHGQTIPVFGNDIGCSRYATNGKDYLDAKNASEAMKVIDSMLNNRECFKKIMDGSIENRERFSIANVKARWKFLFEEIEKRHYGLDSTTNK